jgi:hypothetical protein
MATTDRRPAPGGLDPKVISAMKAEWSSKDTRVFRLRVKQIEQTRTGAPLDVDGRREASELVRA